ncbi:creatininase family protein [Carboxylicivirga caseinilyticus]|uniref:creatininase family protein n=1 Tax=Carboxylicivirga caseinilyticus TaxID=3417572 RepID=UPI003D337351|nr:creatininase family protein [Marinilabiliaceae bacterium A049]
MKDISHLQQLTYQQVKDRHYDLAILPWGATEAHNYHLPYGTDNLETEVILKQSVELATNEGASVLILPIIPFGVNTGQMDLPYIINMMPSTQAAIINDVAQSVFNSNIDKLLIFNGHGGNDFKTIIRETGAKYPNKIICSSNWFQVLKHSNYFTHAGEHADEMETSLMMYLYPELVLPLETAGNGQHKKFRVQGLNENWAWAERKWTQVTNDTGVGNPHYSSAEKGEKFFTDVCQVLSKFIHQLATTPNTDFYSY